MFLMLFVFGIAMLLFQAAGVSAAQGVALTIAGIVAPIVTQFLKKWTGATGGYAVILACAVSGVIAIAASFFVGDWHNVGDLIKNAAAVFAIATLVFKVIFADPTPAKI